MKDLVQMLNSIAINTCQILAFFIISIGIIKGLIIYLRDVFSFSASAKAFQESRLQMGYSFSLGLSFLVGGTILKTTITPNWEDIGRLTAIIAIRTVLNYLLLQSIQATHAENSSSASSQSSVQS